MSFFFFFKQKTAYEIRKGDWSSDVCSSDLAAVFAVASTREEIAWTGSGARTSAIGIEPDVALVVDVTHATDYPGADKKHVGDHKLGGGVVLSRGSSVSSVVFDMLVECAEQAKIP